MNDVCKHCNNPIAESFYYCPNCGKKIKEPPFKFSWNKTILLIAESVLLPPLGLIPGIKYFLKNDRRAQILGIVLIGTTIASTVIGLMLTVNLIKGTMKTYNDINQMQNLINTPSTSALDQIKQLK